MKAGDSVTSQCQKLKVTVGNDLKHIEVAELSSLPVSFFIFFHYEGIKDPDRIDYKTEDNLKTRPIPSPSRVLERIRLVNNKPNQEPNQDSVSGVV